jgi:hypothetical protein
LKSAVEFDKYRVLSNLDDDGVDLIARVRSLSPSRRIGVAFK